MEPVGPPRIVGTRLCRPALAPWAALGAVAACAPAVTVAPDPAALGPLTHEARPARIVTMAGEQWLALGEEAIPVAPWRGVQGDCEPAPEADPDDPSPPGVWFAPDGPALVVLGEELTVWGVDGEEQCAVEWAPLLETGDTDVRDELPEGAAHLDLLEAPASAFGVDAELDILPLPGLETVHLGPDAVTVHGLNGEAQLDRPGSGDLLVPEAVTSASLAWFADGAGGVRMALDWNVYEHDDETGNSGSESAAETLVWRPNAGPAVVLEAIRTSSEESLDEHTRHAHDVFATRRAWLVPGGVLAHEVEDRTDEDDEPVWIGDTECVRSVRTSEWSSVWRFESGDRMVDLWTQGNANEELLGDCPPGWGEGGGDEGDDGGGEGDDGGGRVD